MNTGYTPMIKQYQEIKRQYPNEILFFRLGDFYEMFFQDAEVASRELEITLTSRDGGQAQRIPMCGVPYHAAENYIAKLVNNGYKVAICEQVEDPKQAKGIVRRDVVKVITPGTVVSEAFLQDNSNNYLVVLYEEDDRICLAAADISTGECSWVSFSGPHRLTAVCDKLYCLMPAEIVLNSKIDNIDNLTIFVSNKIPHCTFTTLTVEDFGLLEQLPQKHFDTAELPANKCDYAAISYLLYYLHTTVKNDLTHINRLTKYDSGQHLLMDANTIRNLEVTRNIRDGSKKDTLYAILDFTETAMGGRLLKKWLEAPLINHVHIGHRQDAIAELLANPSIRDLLINELTNVYDFERILTRIELGTTNARDLLALKQSLQAIVRIKPQLKGFQSKLLSTVGISLKTHSDVISLIDAAIVENPPFSVREGGMIRPGYDLELDELKEISKDSKKWVQNLESRERESTGIKSLKVGYNKVFGYYIEVTNSNASAVPAYYIRKQTLVNAERYITPELKDFEMKILGAEEKIIQIEYQLFTKIRDYIKGCIKEIQQTAEQVALLDVLLSLSVAASRYNYIRPSLTSNNEIIIKDGRHPIVEHLLAREKFVPNDTILNHHDCELMIITGPNMAGKSTYMRQVAILTLMTQIGSFIPAREASVSPVDRIFTRVGASDDLASGQSTFMVEMTEVAYILKYATGNSLIILDEIGRGTSTYDGMSIARAVIEYIKERIKAKTLFATHYHELTELESFRKGIKNYSVAVKERGDKVTFLRRIVPGGADKSYGIHVAQLAGLPKKLVERAQEILIDLEKKSHSGTADKAAVVANPAVIQSHSLFASSLTQEVLSIDINTITPLEALNILFRLQNIAKQEEGKL